MFVDFGAIADATVDEMFGDDDFGFDDEFGLKPSGPSRGRGVARPGRTKPSVRMQKPGGPGRSPRERRRGIGRGRPRSAPHAVAVPQLPAPAYAPQPYQVPFYPSSQPYPSSQSYGPEELFAPDSEDEGLGSDLLDAEIDALLSEDDDDAYDGSDGYDDYDGGDSDYDEGEYAEFGSMIPRHRVRSRQFVRRPDRRPARRPVRQRPVKPSPPPGYPASSGVLKPVDSFGGVPAPHMAPPPSHGSSYGASFMEAAVTGAGVGVGFMAAMITMSALARGLSR